MNIDNNTVNILPNNSTSNKLIARITRYVGWLIVSAKIIEPIYFSYIYLDVLHLEYILSTLALKSLPWMFLVFL
ncbi:hypothetical protein MTBLM5_210004 [Magnetospirillum sp. LM-5]|nr:hypothetical protein MTBLM5_210004 [Magnetospirillum sp. LM-5]